MSAILLLILRILMAALLYGFLGVAIYTMLRDLKQQGALLAARQPPPITLTSQVDENTITQRYTKPEVVLGREPVCDFSLNDPTVSSQHARLSYHHQQWWLEDLASTNGTYLNNEAITAPVVITSGDQLHLGHIGVNILIAENRSSASL